MGFNKLIDVCSALKIAKNALELMKMLALFVKINITKPKVANAKLAIPHAFLVSELV